MTDPNFFCHAHKRQMEYHCTNCDKNLCFQCYTAHTSTHIIISFDQRSHCERLYPTLSKEEGYSKFKTAIKTQPCHFDLNLPRLVLIVYDLYNKDSYQVKIDHPYTYNELDIMFAVVNNFIYYVPYHSNSNRSRLCAIEAGSITAKPKAIHEFPPTSGLYWKMCKVGREIYMFSTRGMRRYSIDKDRSKRIALPEGYAEFVAAPVMFQERYLIGVQGITDYMSGEIEWQVQILDILDESAGWVPGGTLKKEFKQFTSNFIGQYSILVKGSNKSIYLIEDDLSVIEYFPFSSGKNQVKPIIAPKQINGTQIGKATGSPTYYKGHVWLTEYRSRDLLTYSYVKKDYKVMHNFAVFNQFNVVPQNKKKTRK